MTKAKELRQQSDGELKALRQEKRTNIFQHKNAIARKDKEVKPHLKREERKDVARINTILRERQTEGKR